MTIEHILNDIADAANSRGKKVQPANLWQPGSTLAEKVEAFWRGTQPHHHLERGIRAGYTNTKTAFDGQRRNIAGMAGNGPDIEVARTLLEMLLIRNQAVHGGGLTQLDPHQLRDLIEVLLRSAVLNWKRARQLQWI